jgi:hypothetical protein
MDQAVMVFDDSAARGSAIPTPSEGMVTYLKDTNQVQAYNGAAFAPIGTILQIVSTIKTDTFSSSSTTFVDITGLTATITPSSTSSKIYAVLSIGSIDGDSARHHRFRVLRDSTPVGVGDAAGSRLQTGITVHTPDVNRPLSGAWNFLDSPNSTSALVYEVQYTVHAGTGVLNRSNTDTDNTSFGRSVSTITLMEVAG